MTPDQVLPLCEKAAAEMTARGIRLNVEKLKQEAFENANARNLLSFADKEGFIHPKWSVADGIGRWMSHRPVLLTLRGLERWLDGYTYVAPQLMDFAVMAHLAGQQDLVDAYKAGYDLHYIVAKRLDVAREWAKRSMVQTIYAVSKDEDILKAYPAIAQHIDRMDAKAQEHGYVLSAIMEQRVEGRKRGAANHLMATTADIMRCVVAECQAEGIPLAGVVFDQLLVPQHDILRAAAIYKRVGARYNLRIGVLDPAPIWASPPTELSQG